MKLYKDSKELPLFNYERITETGDYNYMIKGYDGEELEEDKEQQEVLKSKFNDIIREYSISINAKTNDLLMLGSAEIAKINFIKFTTLLAIIEMKERQNALRQELGLPEHWEDMKEALAQIKIRKSDNLQEQKKYIEERIAMWQTNLDKAMQNIENNKKEAQDKEPANINDAIVSIEMILERTIDLNKTSLYRFGKMQEMAIKKVELHNKKNKTL